MKTMRTCLLIIDPQKDFCNPAGSLYVPGANTDMGRLGNMINRKCDKIDQIFVSLDTHRKFSIFHACFWVDQDGNNPPVFTLITNKDILEGKWNPVDPTLTDYCIWYTEELEKNAHLTLCIWPEHCLEGTWGHGVANELEQPLNDWERMERQVDYFYKGKKQLTEQYSIFEAEVNDDDTAPNWDDTVFFNYDLLDDLDSYNRIGVAGEAKSHCVASSVRSMLNCDWPIDPSKIWILDDTMSTVQGCDELSAAFDREMKDRGVNFSRTKHFLV